MLFIIVLLILVTICQNRGVPVRSVFCFPLSPFLTLYIVWRAVILTLVRGGVLWRTIFYPLVELKRGIRPYK